MRIAIIGAGALGGYYGAMLARAGEDVHFLMRRDYNTVKQKGLSVRSKNGDFHLDKVAVYDKPEDIGVVDTAFIGLKTTNNDAYERLLRPVVGEKTMIMTAQNGLGNEETLAQLFPADQISGGLAFLCSNRIGPGIICHLDYGRIHIGNFQREADERLRDFGRRLSHSGIDCLVVDNLALSRWKKLVWNVPFNGLSTLLDSTVDNIVGNDDLKERASRLMREVQTAAHVCGQEIKDDFLDQMMRDTIKMEPYYTSMHLDRREGRPIELESIIGEPLRRGQAGGLDLPEMQTLYEGLKPYA